MFTVSLNILNILYKYVRPITLHDRMSDVIEVGLWLRIVSHTIA